MVVVISGMGHLIGPWRRLKGHIFLDPVTLSGLKRGVAAVAMANWPPDLGCNSSGSSSALSRTQWCPSSVVVTRPEGPDSDDHWAHNCDSWRKAEVAVYLVSPFCRSFVYADVKVAKVSPSSTPWHVVDRIAQMALVQNYHWIANAQVPLLPSWDVKRGYLESDGDIERPQ